MRRIFAPLIFLSLMACGPSSQPPLVRALNAFRAGDYQDFLAAKAQAAEDLKTAIQPSADLCLVSMLDVNKYGAVATIDKMDHAELFRMPDDARYVYAMKIAGIAIPIQPGSFLAQAPIFRSVMSPGQQDTTCAGEKDKMMDALQGGGGESNARDEARMEFLQGWMRDEKAKYGSAYDDKMRSAEMSIESVGYSAPWPPKYDFIE